MSVVALTPVAARATVSAGADGSLDTSHFLECSL